MRNGDNPLYHPETVKKLIEVYEKEKPTIAMLSVIFYNPEFWAFGRIERDKEGNVRDIVEQKDCTPEQLKIKESNPGFYIFDAKWFWENCENWRQLTCQLILMSLPALTRQEPAAPARVALPIWNSLI